MLGAPWPLIRFLFVGPGDNLVGRLFPMASSPAGFWKMKKRMNGKETHHGGQWVRGPSLGPGGGEGGRSLLQTGGAGSPTSTFWNCTQRPLPLVGFYGKAVRWSPGEW